MPDRDLANTRCVCDWAKAAETGGQAQTQAGERWVTNLQARKTTDVTDVVRRVCVARTRLGTTGSAAFANVSQLQLRRTVVPLSPVSNCWRAKHGCILYMLREKFGQKRKFVHADGVLFGSKLFWAHAPKSRAESRGRLAKASEDCTEHMAAA